MRRFAVFVVCALAFAVIAGCGGGGPSCEEECERANEACGVNDDCATLCSDIRSLNAAAECGSEFNAFLDCSAAAEGQELCSEALCEDQANDWIGCVVGYCVANPDDPACQGTASATAMAGLRTGS